MKTAILVYGPDFASSETLVPAFNLLGESRLISFAPSDWRDYDNGLLLDGPAAITEAQAWAAAADLIVLGDSMAAYTLGVVSPDLNWIHWARGKQTIAFFGDSIYHKHPAFFDGIVADINARLFLLPNLMPRSRLAPIPLHHPQPVFETTKEKELTIIHAPGRELKAQQKGTKEIEAVISELQETHDNFNYERIMMQPLAECLKRKGAAHIVIDQMPPNGAVYGLGRTGTESLASGSVVFSKMYDAELVWNHFPPPPVINIQSAGELRDKLEFYIQRPELIRDRGSESLQWAAECLDYQKWIEYVMRHL